jgi:RND superfamily putative drug exporter
MSQRSQASEFNLIARWLNFLTNRGPWVGWALLLLVIAAAIGASQLKNTLKVGGFSIPGTQFHSASAILSRDFGMASEKTLVAVYESSPSKGDPSLPVQSSSTNSAPRLKVSEPPYAQAVQTSLNNLSKIPQVESIESFYNTGIPDLVSENNQITYALIHLKGSEEELEKLTPQFRKNAATPAGSPVTVYLTGQPIANFDIEQISNEDIGKVDLVTFPLILILLIFLLRSKIGGLLPLVVGIVSVLLSLGGVSALSRLTDVSLFAMNIASMIGLGLSIDFSLILICRFQEEWETLQGEGRSTSIQNALAPSREPGPSVPSNGPNQNRLLVQAALQRAFAHSARSVFFSGFTLFTTVSVLTLFPIMILRSITQAIIISTVASLLMFFTLLPFMILKWGHRILPKPIPHPKRRPGFWLGLTEFSIRRPVISSFACLTLLGIMVVPALSMRKIGTTLEVLPPRVESRRAVEVLQGGFGKGTAAPLLLVLDTETPDGIWDRKSLQLIYRIHEKLRQDPRVEKVQSLMSLIPNPSEPWAQSLSKEGIRSVPDLKRIAERFIKLDQLSQSTFFFVFSKQAETHPDTLALLADLRSEIPSWTQAQPFLRINVGGTPAQHVDFDHSVYQEAPPLVAASLLITFFVLMVFFRSLVLPLKAVVLNLISLAASFGLLTLVFQGGYGDQLLGFKSLGGVQVYTPILLFSILFGLSTDYEVFVLSRVKEYIDQGETTPRAAYLGIEKSSRVIGAAAAVMVLVFFSFAFSSVVAVKEIGFSLALAVLIDATLVRMILVPASLVLMQRLNWWLPTRLSRLLPEVQA